MPQSPTPREAATEAVGMPIEQWIDEQRESAARLSYPQIARVLREQHGIDVVPQTVRAWHLDALDRAS